jgi:DNA-binding LacI/PurR family transcriptional regulator
MIGVVVGNPIGPFYSKIITRLTSRIQENGCQPLIFTLDTKLDIQDIVDKVLQYQVDGVIITSSALSEEIANECVLNELPVVLFNIHKPNRNVSCVYSDNIEAGELAAKLFLNTDHKNIVYVGYKNQASTVSDRKEGFFNALNSNGITNIEEKYCDYEYEDGYKVGLNILRSNKIPDAIFCVSDLIAMGIMDAIKYESDLSIPKDISIIGFDDIPQASYKSYELTTIHQPIERLISRTLSILIELIDKSKDSIIIEKVSPNLVIRKSTKPIE